MTKDKTNPLLQHTGIALEYNKRIIFSQILIQILKRDKEKV